MPKTKIEKFIFSILMAIMMVYGMEVYNLSLINDGLRNNMFYLVLPEVLPLSFIVIILEKFIARPIAKKISLRIIRPDYEEKFLVLLSFSISTVIVMCPLMSLVATLIFKNSGSQFFSIWISTIWHNFPMALCWQIFFAGPIVRYLFRMIQKIMPIHDREIF